MKITARIGMFETNSSGTHSVCIANAEDFRAWVEGIGAINTAICSDYDEAELISDEQYEAEHQRWWEDLQREKEERRQTGKMWSVMCDDDYEDFPGATGILKAAQIKRVIDDPRTPGKTLFQAYDDDGYSPCIYDNVNIAVDSDWQTRDGFIDIDVEAY